MPGKIVIRSKLLLLPVSLIAATPALGLEAGEASAPASEDPLDGPRSSEIVVVAERIRGQLDVPQEPIATYDERDIQALGASSVSELVAQISPQTGSGRGRGGGFPVVLINGQRISNFREMRNYPPEAIKRMEVLPEEASLRLGFPADARVVNLILKDNYSSRRIEIDHSLPTRGGFSQTELEATLLRIDGANRFSISASVKDSSPLFESERGVIQTEVAPPGSPDPAAWRTLIADSRDYELNLNWSTGLGKDGLGGQFSLNGNASRSTSTAGSGLDVLLEPLERFNRTTVLSAGAALNSFVGSWRLAVTADASHGHNETLNDRFDGTGIDRALAETLRMTSLATLAGQPLRLPAGGVSTTIKAGFVHGGIESSDTRAGGQKADLKRNTVSAGLVIGLPLTSRREGVAGALGDITLDLSADYDHVSDFGTVLDWSAGLAWSPTPRLGLQASYLANEVAPSLSQLGNPQTVNFNVPVYDPARDETALVAVTLGGNPLLRKERQRDWKLSVNWALPKLSNSTLLIEWFRNRSREVTADFPLLTPEIEAAFPGRVTRDATGRIVALDARSVTFARQSASRLRWGLNLSGGIGKAAPGAGPGTGAGGPGPRGPGGSGPVGAGQGGRGQGMGMGMGRMAAMLGGGGGRGRWSLGAYHTVQFDSRVLIAPGVPQLDLLGGDALSTTGTPRHTIEFNGGLFHKGKGMFFQGSWAAPTRLNEEGLRFGTLTKANLNLFVELGEQGKLAEHHPFTKGLRVSLRFENLFDSRQKVTDENGLAPLSYQPDYLDPRGRVIEFEIRKMF